MNLSLTPRRQQAIIWLLLFLMPIAGMAVDLIAPSLPGISQSLHISSSLTKELLTLYMVGFAFGNFFTGFLSDAWGRQGLLRASLLGFVIASSLPLIFPHIESLLIARLLQGLALGSIGVSVRVIFSDILPTEKLTHMGTLMGTMFGLGPVIGPVIGGYLQFYWGWQACFIFFASVGLLGLILVFIIVPETHLVPRPLNVYRITKDVKEVMMHKAFMGLIVLMGMMYSLMLSFHTLGPFLIQKEMHYSPVFFGHFALYLGSAFLVSTFVSRFLLKKYTSEQITFFNLALGTTVVVLGLISSYLFDNNLMIIGIVSATMFYCCGGLFPLSMGKGMSYFRHISGTAAAMMYLISISITSLVLFLISFMTIYHAFSLFWIDCGLLTVAWLSYWFLLRK